MTVSKKRLPSGKSLLIPRPEELRQPRPRWPGRRVRLGRRERECHAREASAATAPGSSARSPPAGQAGPWQQARKERAGKSKVRYIDPQRRQHGAHCRAVWCSQADIRNWNNIPYGRNDRGGQDGSSSTPGKLGRRGKRGSGRRKPGLPEESPKRISGRLRRADA